MQLHHSAPLPAPHSPQLEQVGNHRTGGAADAHLAVDQHLRGARLEFSATKLFPPSLSHRAALFPGLVDEAETAIPVLPQRRIGLVEDRYPLINHRPLQAFKKTRHFLRQAKAAANQKYPTLPTPNCTDVQLRT